MDEAPKVLRVSFGDFSCTLEGFDDPVAALGAVLAQLRAAVEAGTLGSGAPLPDMAELMEQGRTEGDGDEPEGLDLDALAAALKAPAPPLPEAPPGAPLPEPIPELVPTAPEAPAVMGYDWEADEVFEPDPEDEWAAARAAAAMLGERAAALRAEPQAPQAGTRHRLVESPDEEVDHLLEEAEGRLADPDATRRRDALTALKVAVAQGQREVLGEREDPEDAFRDDFALGEAARGSAKAPAPLRLVAAQRVDLPSGAAEPTRAPKPPEAPEPPSFAEFAGRAGAESLPDLLEAAAAWMAVAKGEGEPARVDLLRLASEVTPVPPSREDALRVFGTLLRQGRLERREGGRVRLAEETRFAGAKIAG